MIAKPVTHSVPMINGNIPNFPFKGCHSVDVIKLQNEFSFRMGYDFMIRSTIINSRINARAIAIVNMSLPAILSFITLADAILFFISCGDLNLFLIKNGH
jgi:hypothetical protein